MGVTRGLLLALIGGIASAILSIGSFGSAPLLAVGLYLGSALAGIAAGTAALLILFNFNSLSTVLYIAGTGLPALLIARQALISSPGTAPNTIDWYPPGMILAWLTAYGLFVFGCVALYFAFSSSGLEVASGNFLREIFTLLLNQSDANFQSDAERTAVKNLFETTTARWAPILAGLLVAVYVLMLVGNATATQGILNRAELSLRPSPSYIDLELPYWLSGALAAAVIVAVLPGSLGVLGQNALIILSIPFLLLGLTVIHTLSRRSPNSRMVLVAFYFALFLFVGMGSFSQPFLALLALLGIAEQWFSLRKRFSGPAANKEDE